MNMLTEMARVENQGKLQETTQTVSPVQSYKDWVDWREPRQGFQKTEIDELQISI